MSPMQQSQGFKRFLRATRLGLLLGVLVLAWPVGSQTQPQTPSPAASSHQVPQPPRSGRGTTLYRGLALPYELIGGFAIHDGDMVVGTPERPVRPHGTRLNSQSKPSHALPRRDLSSLRGESLWPGGIVPYVIEQGFTDEALRTIELAIAHWNSRTVLTLKPRASEPDYVRFSAEQLFAGVCVAELGRVGGAQSIWLGGPDGCLLTGTIHEIGHAVGLRHEHQRVDRGDYIVVRDETLYGGLGSSYTANAPAGGPYDYASVMHYGEVETIPPGMPVSGEQLSAGDIDGVARLYGRPPTATTVSTNPPGLEIIVDGQPATTPARFAWPAASQHVLEAPTQQAFAGGRYIFGRWNDGGPRRRTVTAGPAATWVEANYVVQRSLLACADPQGTGTVVTHPETPDGFHTIRTPVAIEARPAPHESLQFMVWEVLGGGLIEGAPSANPVSVQFQTEPGASFAVRAKFHAPPLFRIDADPGSSPVALRAFLGGNWETVTLPWVSPANRLPDSFRVEVPEVQPEDSTFDDVRYRFQGWSDGGSRSRPVSVPASGGSLTLNLASEYRLRARVGDQDSVQLSPETEDGFYTAGTRVTVRAVSGANRRFAGWVGDVFRGGDPIATVVMDGPRTLEPVFTPGETLRLGEATAVALPASASHRGALHRAEQGYSVWVPADATELVVEFRSSSSVNVDLYASFARDPWWSDGGEGGGRVVEADFESRSGGANERIVIGRDSIPPLTAGIYFISLATPPSSRSVQGTLTASVERSGIAWARPRAFTFSATVGADPPTQTVRLSHLGREPISYKVESDQTWLSAEPREWTRSGPGIEELAIAVQGTGLAPGSHRGALRIVARNSDRPRVRDETVIELPVAFVSVGRLETIPAVSGVEIASSPETGGPYGAGEVIEVQVHFTHPVSVTGSPELALVIGDRSRLAEWHPAGSVPSCGEAYASLAFRYAVESSDVDADGIEIPPGGLRVGGGAIQSAAGAAAGLDLGRHAIASAADHRVDGSQATSPEVAGLWFVTNPQEGDTYGLGEAVEAVIFFSVDIEVTGSPQLALEIGRRRVLAELSGFGVDSLWFRYEFQAEDRDLDGIGVPADALTLNGATIRSLTGTRARLDMGEYSTVAAADQRVDGSRTMAPTVAGVWFSGQPQKGDTYRRGEAIDVAISFGLGVEVSGDPQLALVIGGRRVRADFRGHEGDSLWFRYVVGAEDRDLDGLGVPADALMLNGGAIRSPAGPEARLGLGRHAIAAAAYKADGSQAVAPEVASLWIGSHPLVGDTYGMGEDIEVAIVFSVDIQVTGSPQLALVIGSRRVQASLFRHQETVLWFRYTVQAEDQDADGLGIPADALSLSGGSIRGVTGSDTLLTLERQAIAVATDHKVSGGG